MAAVNRPALAGALAALAALAAQAPAQAQGVEDEYNRGVNMSVAERPRPDYDPKGVPVGALRLYPRLGLDAAYTDNLFATNANKVSDEFVHLQPAFDLTSDWSRNMLKLSANLDRTQYVNNTSQNTTDYGASLNGRLDIGVSSSLSTTLEHSRLTESRALSNAAASAVDPTVYTLDHAMLSGVHQFDRLRLRGWIDYQKTSYDDSRGFGGVILNNEQRDRSLVTLRGRVDYAVSPDTAFFVSVAYNDRNYRLKPPIAPDLSSTGYEVLTGANFDITALLRGEIGVGYRNQTFDAVAGSFGGLAVETKVQYFPTQLTTLTLDASRHFADSTTLGFSGATVSTIGLKVDHELLRNVLLNAQVRRSRDDYRTAGFRNDRFLAGFGAQYLLNPNASLALSYDHQSQRSHGLGGFVYDANDIYLALTLQL